MRCEWDAEGLVEQALPEALLLGFGDRFGLPGFLGAFTVLVGGQGQLGKLVVGEGGAVSLLVGMRE